MTVPMTARTALQLRLRVCVLEFTLLLTIHPLGLMTKALPSLHAEDACAFALTQLTVHQTSLPEGLSVHETMGKGSNNRVCRATWFGKECVLRMPRRRSDTQQRGAALWEFAQTLRAAQLGAAPRVYHAWFARHAVAGYPSGLYMVMEHFPHDVQTLQTEERQMACARRADIGDAIVKCLSTLATNGIFVFDLKPSNIVVRASQSGTCTARVIDFGYDFSEWNDEVRCSILGAHAASKAKFVSYLKRVLAAQGREADDALAHHIMFAAMLVQLSATTTEELRSDRHATRMDRATRIAVHCVAPHAVALLDSMEGRNIALVRHLLRQDDVRGVLRHYNGRRNAGTRRTLCFARGELDCGRQDQEEQGAQ